MKTMKFTLLTLFLCMAYSLFSQTFTASDLNPVVGDTYIADIHSEYVVVPGSASSTWDFSHLQAASSAGSITTNYVQPSSTPHASSFPSSNIVAVGNSGGQMVYSYFTTSATNMEMVGQVAQSIEIPFSNPISYLEFPLSFGSSYTDTYGGIFTSSGFVYHRQGSETITVDGAGTLIMPFGTYDNVLRVKTVRFEKDSTNYGGVDLVQNYEIITYNYFRAGYHFPFVMQTQLKYEGVVTNEYTSVASSQSVGIQSSKPKQEMHIYPNPLVAGQELMIELDGTYNELQVQVFDMKGSRIKDIEVQQVEGNTHRIHTGNMPKGMYFVQVMDSKGQSLKQEKLIVM